MGRQDTNSPSLVRDIRTGVGTWMMAGACVGLWIAGLTARVNPSIRTPVESLALLATLGALYAVLVAPLGIVATLALRRLYRERDRNEATGSSGFHALAALATFVVFVASKAAADRYHPAGETRLDNLAAALGLGLVGLVLAVYLLSRKALARALARAAWAGPVLLVAPALFPVAGWLAVRSRSVEAAAPLAAARPRSTSAAAPRVILFGVDGADWSRIYPLMRAGRLPHFEQLCRRGVTADLATSEPTWSPIVWTTIVTGVTDDRHGVRDFTELRIPGLPRGVQRLYRKPGAGALLPRHVGLAPLVDFLRERRIVTEVPVTSLQRRSKAIWDILSEQGISVGVVRWWATWPAEALTNGFVVSNNDPWERAFLDHRPESPQTETTGVTWPPGLLTEMVDVLPEPPGRSGDPELAACELLAGPMFAELNADERAQILENRYGRRDMFLATQGGDRFAASAGLFLWEQKHVDFLAVYVRGVDVLSHRMDFTGVVDRYYEWIDGLLGEYLDAVGESASFVLVSDHGWSYEPPPHRGHQNAPDGVMILSGPAFEPGPRREESPPILQLAPTLLALYSLPPSREMTASAMVELLRDPEARAAALAEPVSYGAYSPRIEVIPRLTDRTRRTQEEELERLRSLGYLGG